MVKVFYGNNTIKVREAAFSYVHEREAAGSRVEVIDNDSYASGYYADAAGGASLFGEQTLYVIDTPSQKTDWYDDTVAHLDVLASSSNEFVIIEGGLLAPEKKKFAKHASTLEEFKSSANERFNTFALADALARKDKRALWLIYNEARLSGIAVEELIGILWWQLKALRLAAATPNAAAADMKEFPYNKAKRSLQAFADGELERLSTSLIILQHESRLGQGELDLSLEAWLLRI